MAVGPVDKLFFNDYANIRNEPDGSVIISTGTSVAQGAEFVFHMDGSLSSGGVAFSKGSGSTPGGGVSEQFVEDAIDDAVQGLASKTYVDDKVQDAVGGGSPVTVPSWTRPTLLNNWKAYPDGPTVPHEAPGHRKVGHRIEFTGSLAGGEVVGAGIQAGQSCGIFRLPVGSRPLLGQKTLLVSGPGNTVGTIKVFPDGMVVYVAGALNGEISLHGVSFTLD